MNILKSELEKMNISVDDVIYTPRFEVANFEKVLDENGNIIDYLYINVEIIETAEEFYEKQANKIDICLDDLKQNKVKDSKIKLEEWLSNNPLLSTVHNPDGEYYTVTDDKQSLLSRNLMLAQISQSSTTTWNSTSNICEVWTIAELSQLALEIEAYVRPRITKQQHYEVEINSCTTDEELDEIVFDYEKIAKNLQ